MSAISSIDTSIYSGLIESRDAVSGRNAPEVAKAPTLLSSDVENSKVDLSNYYSNIRPEDLLTMTGNNVSQSAEALDNAMVSAIENGYTVQDAVNINLAKAAYQANCTVFSAVNEMSTFELSV